MEKIEIKNQKITKEELDLILPFVIQLNENNLRTPEDFKVAIEQFTKQTIDMELIMNLNRFSNWIEEEDMRLIVENNC